MLSDSSDVSGVVQRARKWGVKPPEKFLAVRKLFENFRPKVQKLGRKMTNFGRVASHSFFKVFERK